MQSDILHYWPGHGEIPCGIRGEQPVTFDKGAVTCPTCRMLLKLPDTIKPEHYKVGDMYEHAKVVNAWGLNYQLGCATKYIARAGKKDPTKHVEDLKKAIRYIEMEIERITPAPTLDATHARGNAHLESKL